MTTAPEITVIEVDAEAAGIPMADVLAQANVNTTTWWRWKNSHSDPRLGTLRKVSAALADLQAAKRDMDATA
jgi:hypothetical protein